MINQAKVSLVVILSENHVIARHGKIPWSIPPDQVRYRNLIKNHIAICGRKTIDESYTETENIVITSQPEYVPPVPAHVVHSVDEAFAKAEELLSLLPDGKVIKDEIVVIGGGEIFTETIKKADRLYLTIVHEETDGDTFFPDYGSFTEIISNEEHESDGYRYAYLDLEKP